MEVRLDLGGSRVLVFSDYPDHLIENPVAVSIDEARILKAKWALRWKLRKCRGCEAAFDISEGGLYYLCHECVEEAKQ